MKRRFFKLIAPFLVLSAVSALFLFTTSSCSNDDVDDQTTTDTCGVWDIYINPPIATIQEGQSLVYHATCYDQMGNRIVGGPTVYWSANSHSLQVYPLTGEVITRYGTSGTFKITARARRCDGRWIEEEAKLKLVLHEPSGN